MSDFKSVLNAKWRLCLGVLLLIGLAGCQGLEMDLDEGTNVEEVTANILETGATYQDEIFKFSFDVPHGWELRLTTFEPFVVEPRNGVVPDVGPSNRRRFRICPLEVVTFNRDCVVIAVDEKEPHEDFTPEKYVEEWKYLVLENPDQITAVIRDPAKVELPDTYKDDPADYLFPFSAKFFLDYPEVYAFDKIQVTIQWWFYPFQPLETQELYPVFQKVVESFRVSI